MDMQHEFAAFEFASLELAGGLLVQETASVMDGSALLNGSAAPYANQSLSAIGASVLNIPVHAIALTTQNSDGAAAVGFGLQVYGAPVLTTAGAGQSVMAGVHVYDTVQNAAGHDDSSLDFGAYGAASHTMTGSDATVYAGQCTIKSDLASSGSTTQTLTAARVFDGAYSLQGISDLVGRFCAYRDQQVTINGVSTAVYVPPNVLRYGRLSNSYDVAAHGMEPRGTIKPYETRKTIKPSETRGIVHPSQPRHSQWSEA